MLRYRHSAEPVILKMDFPSDDTINVVVQYDHQKLFINNVDIAYIDTNPNHHKTTFIFLHGNPTSSYLWRNIIPHVEPHARCIAPDLIGMGKSSKPANFDGRFQTHASYLEAFLSKLTSNDNREVYLVLHDWGSALGLDWARQHQDRVAGLVLMEFLRPWPTWDDVGGSEEVRELFKRFRDPVEGRKLLIDDNVFIEQVLPGSICRKLSEAEMDAYRAPFADPRDREPLYRFPNELPIAGQPEDVYAAAEAYHEWLLKSDVEKLFLWASPGAVVSEAGAQFYSRNLRNCHSVHVGAGLHYIQEDHPHLIGDEIAKWYKGLQEFS